jgi:class 3 adenylate cyclase/DNA-binding winged helix-turn-helix (wHTH) protein
VLRFRVLGSVEVLDGDLPVDLPRRKHRALLAILLLAEGRVVSIDRLVDELWGEDPPATARNSLQNYVSLLRKRLGPDVIQTRPPGYELVAAPEQVDLWRFRRLVEQAGDPDPAARAETLREALALWRGPPLADLEYEPFATAEIARLDELRLAAIEARIDADLELGRHAAVIGELETLVREHPLRERLRGQQMLALYRAGRQADALEAYRAHRRVLDEELGLDPGPELQQLERGILTHDAELARPAPTPAAVPAEGKQAAADLGPSRRTVTVLFADVAGWTSIGERLDAEPFHHVLSRYREVTAAVVERHGGAVEKFVGDSVMAVFGLPELHEDDALRAVRAAFDLRAAVARLSAELERDLDVEIEVSIGINSGVVVSGLAGPGLGLAGDPINVASRLQEAAAAGQILIGGPTYRLVAPAVVAGAAEPLHIRGRRTEVTAWSLTALAADRPFLPGPDGGPFVDREDAIVQLRAAFDEAVVARACRVCTVVGPPGIGKSRLAREFVGSVTDAQVLAGRCLPYGEGITYWPLAQMVRSLGGSDLSARVRYVLGDQEHAERAAGAVSAATGIGGAEGDANEIAWAFRLLFETLARRQPLIVVVDDVHWAEPTLLDLLEYAAGFSTGAAILLLCLARPELLESRPGWGAPQPSRSTVAPEPLSEPESAELLEGLGGDVLSSPERDRLIATAEGNPLFLEELLAFRAEDEASTTPLPPTVQALLAARIDRLAPDERAVLGHAAVEGRTFHLGALAELAPKGVSTGLQGHLMTLIQKQFVTASRSELPGEDAFRFRHILIRDAAYETMPKQQRAQLHARFAAWLERKAGERVTEFEEVVGYHLERAYCLRTELGPVDGEARRLAFAAGERLAAPGLRAFKRGDDAAAVSLLGRATTLLPPELPARSELLCELALALRRSGRLADADRTLEEAARAASATGEGRLELRARIEQTYAALFTDPQGKAAELLDLLHSAIPVFDAARDERSLGRAWTVSGFLHAFRGENAAWEQAEERAWTHLRKAGWPAAPTDMVAAALQGPRPVREVVARCDELLTETRGDPHAEAGILVWLGGLEGLLGRFESARRHISDARAIWEEFGDRAPVARACAAMSGQVEALAGDLNAAEQAWRDGCGILEEMGDVSYLASQRAELADVLYQQGKYEEADRYSRLAGAAASQDDVYTQVVWRIAQAKLAAESDRSSEAEVLARAAVDLAARTDALVLIGRAQLALTEVLRVTGRRKEAAVAAREALAAFERKGDVVSTRRTRALVRRLEPKRASLSKVR